MQAIRVAVVISAVDLRSLLLGTPLNMVRALRGRASEEREDLSHSLKSSSKWL